MLYGPLTILNLIILFYINSQQIMTYERKKKLSNIPNIKLHPTKDVLSKFFTQLKKIKVRRESRDQESVE